MKAYKEEIIKAMEEKAVDLREFSLKEVATELGYNRLSADDSRFILTAFCKRNPEYKVMWFSKNDRDSLFNAAYVTMLDYESEAKWLAQFEEVNE